MNSNLVVLSESPAVLYTQFFGLIILQFSKADETQPGEPQPGAVGRPTAPVAERLLGPLRLVPWCFRGVDGEILKCWWNVVIG